MAARVFRSLQQSLTRHCPKNVFGVERSSDSSLQALPAVLALSLQQCRHYSFFQLDKVFSLKRLQEERLRLQDEMDRGYFEDFKDLKKNQGKLGPASKGLLPVASCATFPELLCRTEDGSQISIQEAFSNKDVTLACVAFRQNAQSMVDSWNQAFENQLQKEPATQLVELSVIESVFLRPFQSYLVKSMSAVRRGSSPVKATQSSTGPPVLTGTAPELLPTAAPNAEQGSPSIQPQQTVVSSERTPPIQKQVLLYHFAETWAMRKALNMPNRLTAYALLVDRQGRVRWRATGFASEDEVTSLQRATRLLVKESAQSAAAAREKDGSGRTSAGQETKGESGGEGLR